MEERIFEIFQSHKDELYDRFHVESLSIFGSICRGSAREDSDIDILVRYTDAPGIFEFLKLKQYLESILGRSVDLVTENALKKQLKNKILKEAVRVA
jgi:hypothetical protein